jgi:hypothetical protein
LVEAYTCEIEKTLDLWTGELLVMFGVAVPLTWHGQHRVAFDVPECFAGVLVGLRLVAKLVVAFVRWRDGNDVV